MAVVPFVLGLGPKFRVLSILKQRHAEQVKRSNQHKPAVGPGEYSATRHFNRLQIQIPLPKMPWRNAVQVFSEPSSPTIMSPVSADSFQVRHRIFQ
jgi:hypothetical protein